MSFTMDDIDEIMQVLHTIKESKDCELHLKIGDMKLSVWKGDAVHRSGSSIDCSTGGTIVPPKPIEQKTSTVAAILEEEVLEDTAKPDESLKGQEAIEEGLIPVKASVTSVFYRRPSPGEPPFVEVGSEVEENTVICILEVMKCFRSTEAGVRGRVEKILVENGELVEFGTVLMLIRPS